MAALRKGLSETGFVEGHAALDAAPRIQAYFDPLPLRTAA